MAHFCPSHHRRLRRRCRRSCRTVVDSISWRRGSPQRGSGSNRRSDSPVLREAGLGPGSPYGLPSAGPLPAHLFATRSRLGLGASARGAQGCERRMRIHRSLFQAHRDTSAIASCPDPYDAEHNCEHPITAWIPHPRTRQGSRVRATAPSALETTSLRPASNSVSSRR